MRSDAMSRHYATHAREILKMDKRQLSESVADKSVCVYMAKRGKHTTGMYLGPYVNTEFACCLVCGKHSYCNASLRFECPQWCMNCDKPFNEECETCNYRSTRKCPTDNNKCDDFVQAHNASCGRHWESVADWFDMAKPAPKLKIANRLTDVKRETKLPRKTLAAKPAVAPTPAGPDPRDLVATVFDDMFDHYHDDEDDDEYDAEEYAEQRSYSLCEMLEKIRGSRDRTEATLKKKLQAATSNIDKLVQDGAARAIAAVRAELTETEAELHKTRDKLNRQEFLADDAAAQAERRNKQSVSRIQYLEELLRENGIAYST